MIFSIEWIYIIMGLIGFFCSLYTFTDKANPRRLTSGLFYMIYALTLLFGKEIPPFYIGLMVIAMVMIVALGGLRKGHSEEPDAGMIEKSRSRLKNRLFIPALLIPILTVAGAKWLIDVKFNGKFLLDPTNPTLVALGIACVVAIIVALVLTRSTPKTAVKESRRLMETIGWAIVLPQLLATLGVIFTQAGVGKVITQIISAIIPAHSLFAVVFVFCIGMALFTMIMGNAFAAFPIMAAGIAIPLMIRQFGANPDQIAAISMFAGYCGTLMTPMAANFNIVPAALLNLRDPNHVIRVQIPTALLTLAFNICLMYFLA